MKILHVSVEADEGWLIAQGLEEPAVITQARTLDQLVANIREVVQLLKIADDDLHFELIVPPTVRKAVRPQRKKPAPRRKFKPTAVFRD